MAATWYLGPLGDLRPLPCPDPSVNTTLTRYGGTHQGITGARTVDVTGHRAEYQFDWTHTEPDELAWIEALHARHVAGPVRMLNPLKRNRLTPQASALQPSPHHGVGVDTGYAAWSWSLRDYPADAQPGYRSLQLFAWSEGDRDLELDAVKPTVVLGGETVTASVYLRCDGDTSAELTLTYADDRGHLDEQPTESALVNLDEQWSRHQLTHTVADDALSVVFTVRLAPFDQMPVYVAAPQLESGEVATAWTPGGGAPVVSVDQWETSSPEYRVTDCSLTLVEI